MILVKSLIGLKRLIYGIAIIVLRPLFLLVKLILTKPLIKVYHLIFKLKKSSLAESPWHELLRQRLVHVLVLCLTLIMIILNFFNFYEDSHKASTRANKTIIFHLAKNEFSTISDESALIEEKSNLKQILTNKFAQYEEGAMALVNRPWLSSGGEEANIITYENDALVNRNPLALNTTGSSETSSAREGIISYTVENGDTVSGIANKFQVSVNTILWANNLSAYSLIRPGNTLTILPTSGVVHKVKSGETVGKIALQYGVEEKDIFSYNDIKSANSLVIGQNIIIPGGRKTTTQTAVASKPSTPASVVEKLTTPKKATDSGSSMVWPTEGHRITQYYSWRHTGLDIANKTGTPLYAAEAGTVEYSGWSNGYGYNVLVNHGGGKKTRYAHASKLYVKVGDKVARGEQIAAMGSTGWSTGPHIHFEVIVNGVKQNPLNYIR